MEAIDHLDRYTPQLITFSDLPQLNWIFRYQGQMSQAMINALTVSSFVGDQLTLTNLPVTSSSRVMFEPNDLIQIGNYTYPFTSVTQVLRGSGGSVTVTTHRPNIIPDNVVGEHIKVGSSCEFNLFCPNMPTYRLFPGGTMYNENRELISNARIEWSDNFELYEYFT